MNKLLSHIADFLGLGIYQRVARTKKKLSRLEKLVPTSSSVSSEQRWVLDQFFCHVATLLSFGEIVWDQPPLEVPESKDLCFEEFARSPEPFVLLCSIVQHLICIRLERRYGGKKVDALLVVWINIPHKQRNPFGEIGFFAARAYTRKPPEPTPTP